VIVIRLRAVVAAAGLFFGVLVPSAGAAPACAGQRATIVGTDRADHLTGTPGRDVIVGLGGTDLVDPRGGDDLVCTGRGDDLVESGPGDDVLDGGPGDDFLGGGDGADRVSGGAGTDGADGGLGSDRLSGGAGRDVVSFGEDRAVRVDAGAGTARGQGADSFAGFEIVLGSPRDDGIVGSDGRDFLVGMRGDDDVAGRGGEDTLSGHRGEDALDGGAGFDFVSLQLERNSSGFVDLARRRANDDRLTSIEGAIGSPDGSALLGDAGDNVLRGLGGYDRIDGRGGNDRLDGGKAGLDTIVAGPGDDVLIGGEDATLSYEDAPAGADVDFPAETATGWGDDVVRGFGGFRGSPYDDRVVAEHHMRSLIGFAGDDELLLATVETVSGFEGNDTIVASGSIDGGEGDDDLSGLEGADDITGGPGNDRIAGGAGHDTIDGGEGDDTLEGGEGADVVEFVFAGPGLEVDLAAGTATGHGSDTLAGFETVRTTIHDDLILGSEDADWIESSHGHDVVRGRGGDDTIDADLGTDWVDGGDGTDRCVDAEDVTSCEKREWWD
jgi:Ca2+-binding RTX toxin-like protein